MKKRIIARLDIKNDRLIKGVHLEGLRVVGDPVERALDYYESGIDELILVDTVASLYQRNHLADVIHRICKKIFIPVTVGGGIRSLSDAEALFDAGADKVAINTQAVSSPELISQLSRRFGAQAVVLSVQAKLDPTDDSRWLVMTDNGREDSGRNVVDWISEAQSYGFGEILLTSIDKEGTGSGFDLDLLTSVASASTAPILISGGFAKPIDAIDAFKSGAEAVVIAQAFHYNKCSIPDLKSSLALSNLSVRLAS